MCIRDSTYTDEKAAAALRALFATGLFKDVRIEIDGRIAVPVSYTHLRAHETVLDLVCRLLLEKKKQARNLMQHIT